MIGRDWFNGRRRVRLSFLGVTLLLTIALGWLGWRLLEQDEQLSTQRLAEQREAAADALVVSLERRFSSIERDLDVLLTASNPSPTAPAADACFVRVRGTTVDTWPAHALVYQPFPSDHAVRTDLRFANADRLEFQRHDYGAALEALGPLLRVGDPQLSADAIARSARLHLKAGNVAAAAEAYRQLSLRDTAIVGQMPAPIAADLGRMTIAAQQSIPGVARVAAHRLLGDLESGRWAVSRATYEYLVAEASRHVPASEQADQPRSALSDVVETVWNRWVSTQYTASSGRLSLATPTGPMFVVWRATGETLALFVADRAFVERQWLAEATQTGARRVGVVIVSSDGAPIVGAVPTSSRLATRLASSTTLPWTVQVFNDSDAEATWNGRRRLLVAGLGVLLALIVSGAWFIDRAVERELAVADLQSDFVSAVSHEFRTPLTTLVQLSELLMRDRVATPADRREYYSLLYNESHRLSRLVEALLDFGRLEAGRTAFQFEPIDAAALVEESATAFAAGRQALGHRFEVTTGSAHPQVNADRETLRCALWNLFENAAKYSPECDTVWVALSRRGTAIEIAVRDRGVGIPRDEQRTIFDKFVRGRTARASGVRGTGIGLAMAHHIVRAHGGSIEVESEPGTGSTFRVVLPEATA